MAASSSQNPSAPVGGNSKWYVSWSSLISEGARALASLMPLPHQGHQLLNNMRTEGGDSRIKLETLCKTTATLLRQHSAEGNLKWRHVGTAENILNMALEGPICKFMPRTEPFRVFTGSDSTLSMFTKGQGRPFESHWAENKKFWERHVKEAHFAVTPTAVIQQIWGGLETRVRHHPQATVGGNPETFADQLVLISCMNEKTHEKDETFRAVRNELEDYPIGSVIILGPGAADHWWPDCVGSAGNVKWTTLSQRYFDILSSGKHAYIRGDAPLGDMEIRQWIAKKSKQLTFDHHYQDSSQNIIKMTNLITNLAVLNRMLAALYEIGCRYPIHVPFAKWTHARSDQDNEEATRSSLGADQLDDDDLALCKKWAALANIPLPCKGNQYMMKTDRHMYYNDKFLRPVGTLKAGDITGEVAGYSFWESTSTDVWSRPSGIYIEYQDVDEEGNQCTIFVQITCNTEAYVELYQTSDPLGGVWSEDKCPEKILCLEDAKPADIIEILIAAGIEEDIEVKDEPGTEATRGASTYSWLKSPPTDTDDGGSEPGLQHVKSEATQDDDEPAN